MKRVALPETAAETLFGNRDENLRFLEDNLKVRIKNDGHTLVVEGNGEGEDVVVQLFDQLGSMMKDGYAAAPGDVRVAAQLLSQDPSARLRDFLMKAAIRGAKKVVVPRSLNQRAYLEELEKNDMVFGIGPAGTGKTYLAVAQAVASLLAKSVARIVLARPAVEAGEKLGFLPGDLQDKVDPYLRPLYDALYDMLGPDGAKRLLEGGTVEVAPLAFMRGRTLNDSFIILDEAQNTTPEQMKMFLTRIGFGSKAVVTGDITQIDLPREQASGLIQVREILAGIEGIGFVEFGHEDVVRHKLVQRIVEAYKRHAESTGTQRSR